MDAELRKHIENLRRDALERDPEERETFVEESCAGNEELRQAVLSLLTESELRTNPETLPAADLTTQELDPGKLQWPDGPYLGHYRVLAQLGKGAMGVVYLAHDDRLRRKIALKMLPVEYTKEQSRLKRFEREARAASALNHPNVITVHEVGESNGIHFIATEFIEGNTLRRVMATEKIELREKLRIGAQIAAALDSTHRAKVIHRDIKPENIMVRPDGLVKVLDFGLARLTPDRGTSDDHQVNVLAETQAGMWAGTPRYMSPEQVKGLELDSRTDIFSLGVVLYEMIAGRAPFGSEKPEDLFEAISNEEPVPVSMGRSEVPVELEEIIHKALEKNPDRRFQSAGEMGTQLDAIRQKLEREKEEDGFFHRHRVKLRIGALVAALAAIAFFSWWATHQPPVRPTPVITRLKNMRVDEAFASFSPDGRSIAYNASIDGEQRIWIRRIDGEEASAITDGASKDRSPIWSPNGERLAFVSDRAGRFGIWSISTLGGQPELIKEIDMPQITLTSWSKRRNAIYFEVSPNLFTLDLTSGVTSSLTNFDAKHSARSFSVSPDESQIAFSALVGQKSRILVMPLAERMPRQITSSGGDDDHSPNWLSDGKTIVYGSRLNSIYELFTVDIALRVPLQITFGDSNYQPLAVSPNANKILAVSEKDNANVFYLELATQSEVGLTEDFGLQLFPDVAPDGRKVLYHASDSSMQGQGAIMVKEIDAGRQPLPIAPAGRDARWGRDSDVLAFLEGPANGPQLWVARESGGTPKRLTEGPVLLSGWTRPPRYRLLSGYDWSPDGTRIAYCAETPGKRGLRVVSIDGQTDTPLTSVTDESMKMSSPIWSPDGQRIAYVLEPLSYSRSGKRSIHVFENGESQTVFERDERLRLLGWSASGHELFVALGERPEFSPPQEVKLLEVIPGARKQPEARTIPAVYLHSVKLSSDGQRIAMTGRQDGRDNLMITSALSGPATKVTSNADPTIYYSGLTWSPDGKRLFYSKQTNWAVATLIENFK